MSAAETRPSTGEVESCRECGASLAPDQRYCLNCGRRRGEPRLDFRRYIGTEGEGRNGAAAQPPQAGAGQVQPQDSAAAKPARDYTPLAAAGGIAVLGLMLLVGVLIGRGDGGGSSQAPPPVVRVEGEGGGEEKTAGNEPAAGEGVGLDLSAKGKSKSGGKKGSAEKAPAAEITASDDELKALEEQSPQEYSESSAKLPNEIATPGAAPPKDSKKPGGGSSGTTIE